MNKRIKKKMDSKCFDCIHCSLCRDLKLIHCKGKDYYKDFEDVKK